MKKTPTTRHMWQPAALVLGFAVLAGTTAANPDIGQVTHITEGLINTAIAYEIDRVCDSISGRRIEGINFLWSLKVHANELGYSDDEVRAYVDNRAEKDRLEAIARDRLRGMGAVEGQPETYCAVGRAEMAARSDIGRFLR
jgi:uncharacterized membrane protein